MTRRFPFTCAALLYAAALAAASALHGADPATWSPEALTVAAPRVVNAGRYIYAPSHVTGSAIYSAVYIAAGTERGQVDRATAGKFKADDNLPAEMQARPADYADSGHDTGHLVEFAALDDDQTAAASTFNLSNAVPQNPTLNRGLWNRIEREARDLADRGDGVLIVNLPIYDYRRHPPKTIGAGHIFRPTDLAKVALVFRDKKPHSLRAWIVPNAAPAPHGSGTANPDHYRATGRQVEIATQLDLFPTLQTDELENPAH